jgi:Spy/CpxP family protein refolding chaperone
MLVLVLSLGASQGAPRSFRWWLDPCVQRDLGLTGKQVDILDAEYNRTVEHRRLLGREFDAASRELTRALARGDLPDDAAKGIVVRVEDLRRQRNVARRQLLVKMYFLLTPDQRANFSRVVRRAAIDAPPC